MDESALRIHTCPSDPTILSVMHRQRDAASRHPDRGSDIDLLECIPVCISENWMTFMCGEVVPFVAWGI